MNKIKTFFSNLFNKVQNFIGNTIKLDDILHEYFSLIIFILTFNLYFVFSQEYWLSVSIATIVTLTFGFIKEYAIDKLIRDSEAEIRDLTNDSIGIIIGILLTLSFR